MSKIGLTSLKKVYDDGVVGVQDVSFEVDDGEFLSLVGPSGCGKSTMLELMAGLLKPTDGTIRFGREIVNDTPPQERDLAMVFQDYALYPHKTVRGNMLFGLKYSTDLPQDQKEQKVEEAAKLLDIEDLLDQKPGQLSGGQQQRVALGRAIVRDPEVFLLDEPLSNLDAKLRTEMRAEIQRLQNELGVTMVYVTHDQTEAMTMSDRIAILDDGELQQVGSPSSVYNDPTNEFVAQFIGSPSMNVFDATVRGASITRDNTDITFEDLTELPRSGRIRVGIRPEDIVVHTDTGEGDATARVSVVENLGKENLLHLDIFGQVFVARVNERIRPAIDDRVGLSFPESVTYIFDREGNSLKTRSIEGGGEREIRNPVQ
jgi:multiple sugar transport system ATP-binding protein